MRSLMRRAAQLATVRAVRRSLLALLHHPVLTLPMPGGAKMLHTLSASQANMAACASGTYCCYCIHYSTMLLTCKSRQ